MTDVRAENQILLRCPACKREEMVTRLSADYPEAVRIEIKCDKCDTGGFIESFYYDAAGNHITRDPEGESDFTEDSLSPETIKMLEDAEHEGFQ